MKPSPSKRLPQPAPALPVLIGAAWIGVTEALAWLSHVPSLLSAWADALLLVVPVGVFTWIKHVLGSGAKAWLLMLIALAVIVGMAVGLNRARDSATRQWRVLVTLFGLAALGAVVSRTDMRTLALQIVIAAIATATIGVLAWAPNASSTGGTPLSRRTALLGTVATVLGVGGLARVATEAYRIETSVPDHHPQRANRPTALTPNDDFYRISKNFNDPDNARGDAWTIRVHGAVDQELTLSRADLDALGGQHHIATQLCISNEVGGDLIGTAEWYGVPLLKVLERAGLHDDVRRIIYRGADGYSTAVGLDRIRRGHAWVVWEMNGEPLPIEHGAPVRVCTFGLYGMKGCKWLTEIEASPDNYQGYWEMRGWTDDAVVHTMSRIDAPANRARLDAGAITVEGIAFAGDRGIRSVELSTDGGTTWNTARITDNPNPAGIAWSLWSYVWEATPGKATLIVRATDGDGSLQTSDRADPLPSGSTGLHRVDVVVG